MNAAWLTVPFWFGFVGSALLVALMWRRFAHIAHAAEAGIGHGTT